MPTTPEAIIADIEEAATAGFRGSLIAKGQARAIIWRDGVLPHDAPAFSARLSHDLSSYGYALLGLGLRLRELDGDAAHARIAFERAASALEAVIAKGDPNEPNRDFPLRYGGSKLSSCPFLSAGLFPANDCGGGREYLTSRACARSIDA